MRRTGNDGNDVDTSAEESFEETPAVAAVETGKYRI